jgi:Putative peptidoglycan binding domain
MACYQRGSLGPEVGNIQQKLNDLRLYSGPIDGNYGGGTETAVKAFQRGAGLAPDGDVGPATWTKLFPGSQLQEPAIRSQPITNRCLALTGSFETDTAPPECFAGLTGDFDGQGISLGVCQWNLGQGSLQPLLNEIDQSHQTLVTTIFNDYASEFRRVLASSNVDQVAWARSIQSARHAIGEPWQGLFKALARTPEFQAIETEHAGRLFVTARTMCSNYGVQSERALALMFDIAVQNGAIKDVVRAQIERDFAALDSKQTPEALEVARLQIVANRRAAAANPAWVNDVRIRKLTIANGQGVVHGRHYDLEAQYGISLAKADTGSATPG